MLGMVEDCKARLWAAGLRPGMVVGLHIADEVQHLVTSVALLCMDTCHVTLPTFDTDDVREDLAARCQVDALVDQRGVVFVAHSSKIGPGAGGLYLRTSGTTGQPSIVNVSPQQLVAQANSNAGYDTHRLSCLASIEHNNAKRHRLYTAMRGGTNVFRAADEANSLVEFCGRYGVTCLDVAPIHAAGLVATVEGRPLDKVTVRVSGSLVPPALRSSLETRVTRKVSVRYGATECGTIAVTADGRHAGETVGRPCAGVRVEIVDAAGDPVAPGESGVIRVRTLGSASGYLDDPDLSASRFRDGWFLTGDVGHFNLDGELVVEGRRDDMMILNGINIFPAEIEEALELHHAVRAAAAAPVRSATHGDIPVAVVELRPGVETTPEALLAFARQRLALRAPRRISIVDEIPRNSQGKVLRRRVQEIVVSGKNKSE